MKSKVLWKRWSREVWLDGKVWWERETVTGMKDLVWRGSVGFMVKCERCGSIEEMDWTGGNVMEIDRNWCE